jgi:hydroxysqualene synthase
MTETASALASGKGHTDENFPVASVLIHPRHRAAILAFYRFARTADDVADHPTAPPDEKLRLLEDMRQSLNGNSRASAEAVALRQALGARGLSSQHALDLLEAFRRDVTKLRYADWNELMDYCRYSAMPVGRFVLDVHGEDHATWPYNDALCAALQVINHLQDCAKDYQALDRVYLPLDALERAGAKLEDLNAGKAGPALRRVIADLAHRTSALLVEAQPFAGLIADFRLGLEVTVIQRLAESLNRGLLKKDPLSERVHHRKSEMLGLALVAATRFSFTRTARPVS